jgi:hypothetical protein
VGYLIQILLPRYDNEGQAFGREPFAETRQELLDRFGGLTAFLRAPASGLWKADDGTISRDDIVMMEVMAADLDRGWWRDYRRRLEARFRQDEIVVRAIPVDGIDP